MRNLSVKKGMLSLILIYVSLSLPAHSLAIEIEAITKPSGDVMLSFVRGGRVKDVLVREGDRVQDHQLLATLENEVELLQLKQLEVQAGSTAMIESVKLEIAQKEQDAKKLEWAKARGAVTSWEVDHNRIDLQTAKISLRQARVEHTMTKLHRDEVKAQLELLSIHSPINGRVERVQIEPGESPQPLTPVIRVVKIDPLFIDVHVPIAEARELSLEQPVSVKTTNEATQVVEATIRHIAAVADAASMTLRVQLELLNPTQRPAGERVQVQF